MCYIGALARRHEQLQAGKCAEMTLSQCSLVVVKRKGKSKQEEYLSS